jgi:antitoxin (DNA-binding transcriptional repressor) of toxin-antitoxin stability system
MRRVGVRELKEHTSQILRELREHGEIVDVTHRGEVIARLIPVGQSVQEMPIDREKLREFWERWDELAAEISADWPDGVSAQDAIRDVRRDL